ncbi:hypothetical protein [uncultured Deinococcus sp.]|uniref:hypothetical protein n=1 Tax=uncultured Deinococcus sp. TaxID=158789 RepID=UPI0025D25043|nr:hypothetical protein [uncultured Deinococcus sp.]
MRVYDRAGNRVNFNGTTYAPTATDDTTDGVTLSGKTSFKGTVRLPEGDYRFETILRDGINTTLSTGLMLAYGNVQATVMDKSNVQLKVQAVADVTGLTLDTPLPVGTVYTNDALNLTLRVRTATGDAVPTSDYSVGTYTVSGAQVDGGAGSALGIRVRALGSDAQPNVNVSVPVKVLVQDGGTETARWKTVQVAYTHAVASGTLGLDVTEPMGLVTTTSLTLGEPGELVGRAEDDVAVGAARLYDGMTLIASTVEAEVGPDVTQLTFDGTAWSTPSRLEMPGAHTVTLVVQDTSGNESRSTQTVTVTAPTQVDPAWMPYEYDGMVFEGVYLRNIVLHAGEEIAFRSYPQAEQGTCAYTRSQGLNSQDGRDITEIMPSVSLTMTDENGESAISEVNGSYAYKFSDTESINAIGLKNLNWTVKNISDSTLYLIAFDTCFLG